MRTPQHSIDATPVLVLPEDPAWDLDKIEAEIEGLDVEARQAHPYAQYQKGETRYDLHARVTWPGGEGSAADYLKDGGLRFVLQRLSVEHFAEVQDAFSRELQREGEASSFVGVWVKAAKYGIAAIEGDPDVELPRGGRMREATLRAIVDKHGGLDTLTRIGLAVWRLSQPLSDAEKKR